MKLFSEGLNILKKLHISHKTLEANAKRVCDTLNKEYGSAPGQWNYRPNLGLCESLPYGACRVIVSTTGKNHELNFALETFQILVKELPLWMKQS
jgi:hypothetical protein